MLLVKLKSYLKLREDRAKGRMAAAFQANAYFQISLSIYHVSFFGLLHELPHCEFEWRIQPISCKPPTGAFANNGIGHQVVWQHLFSKLEKKKLEKSRLSREWKTSLFLLWNSNLLSRNRSVTATKMLKVKCFLYLSFEWSSRQNSFLHSYHLPIKELIPCVLA